MLEEEIISEVYEYTAHLNMTRKQRLALATCGAPLADLVLSPEIGDQEVIIAVVKSSGYTMGVYPDGTIRT
jgi:hypothetical protein